ANVAEIKKLTLTIGVNTDNITFEEGSTILKIRIAARLNKNMGNSASRNGITSIETPVTETRAPCAIGQANSAALIAFPKEPAPDAPRVQTRITGNAHRIIPIETDQTAVIAEVRIKSRCSTTTPESLMDYFRLPMMARIKFAASLGVLPTLTPTASSASCFA
ncbi:MAG: hypothetical protein RL587_196, partial [Actinomycetota bacterium]